MNESETGIEFGTRWERVTNGTGGVTGHAIVAIGADRIALVGGQEQFLDSILSSVDIWDFRNKTWNPMFMKEKRTGCAAVAVENHLYIFGGVGSGKALDSCEVLDLETGISRELPRMPTARSYFSAVVYHDTFIVVLGGRQTKKYLGSVEMFDTVLEKWTKLPPMPTRRSAMSAAAVGRSVVVAGGVVGGTLRSKGLLASADLLDMHTKTWKTISDMSKVRYSGGGAAVENSDGTWYMIVAGGRSDKKKEVDTVEVYDSSDDSWYPVPSMNQKRGYCQLAVVGKHLVVIGGEDNVMESLPFRFVTTSLSNHDFMERIKGLPYAKDLAAELESTASILGELQQLQQLYTVVNYLYTVGCLAEGKRQRVMTSAFDRSSRFCISPEHAAFYKVALKKAAQDGILDDQKRYTFEFEAVLKTVENASFIKEMQRRVDGLEARLDNVAKTLTDLSNALQQKDRVSSAIFVLTSVLGVGGLGLVGVAANEISRMFTTTVDFVDLSHIQDAVQKVAVAHGDWVVGAFDKGVELGNEMVASTNVDDTIRAQLEGLGNNQNTEIEIGKTVTMLAAIATMAMATETGGPSIPGPVANAAASTARSIEYMGDSEKQPRADGTDSVSEDDAPSTGTETPKMVIGHIKGDSEERARVDATVSVSEDGARTTADTERPEKAIGHIIEDTEKQARLDAIDSVKVSGPEYAPRLSEEDGEQELFAAIYHDDIEVAKEILKDMNEFEINRWDSLGRTPADFAAVMGETEMVDLILQKGGKFKVGTEGKMRSVAKEREKEKAHEPFKGLKTGSPTKGAEWRHTRHLSVSYAPTQGGTPKQWKKYFSSRSNSAPMEAHCPEPEDSD